MTHQDDFSYLFAPETEKADTGEYGDVWKVLLVDDEPDIHAVLRLALQDVVVEGRSLLLLDAKSGEEAKVMLAEHSDIALILLDVVMETEQAGLELVRYVREALGNRTIQIVLVTGQPGYAPQREVVQAYEIDGYRLKSELSADKIFVSVYAALRTYRAMCELERQRALLSVSEARYTDLYEHAPDMYLSVDAATANVMHCNQTVTDKLGYSKNEIIGRPVFELYHPDSLADAKDCFSTFAATGKIENAELQLRSKDGSRIDVALNATAVCDENEKLLFSRSSWTDITERKQAEIALRENEERLRLALGASNQAWFDVNVQTGVVRVSSEYPILIGFEPGDFETSLKNWQDHLHPSDKDGVMVAFQTCLDSGGPISMEYRRQTKDGGWAWIHSIGKIVEWDAAKRPLRMIGIHMEISPRKHFEEQLRRERDFAENLVNTAPAIVVVLDPDGRIVRINPYMEMLSGYTLAEVKGKDWFATFLPKATQEQTRALFLGAINDIQTTGNLDTIVTRSSQERVIEWHDKTLKDGEGNTLGLLAIGQDVTARKEAEDRLHALNRDLEQRVIERTAKLDETIKQIESFNEVLVGREMRVIEVKQQVNQFCRELGRDLLYPDTENAMTSLQEDR
jgi:PAS domain S-box-containing protein